AKSYRSSRHFDLSEAEDLAAPEITGANLFNYGPRRMFGVADDLDRFHGFGIERFAEAGARFQFENGEQSLDAAEAERVAVGGGVDEVQPLLARDIVSWVRVLGGEEAGKKPRPSRRWLRW